MWSISVVMSDRLIFPSVSPLVLPFASQQSGTPGVTYTRLISAVTSETSVGILDNS